MRTFSLKSHPGLFSAISAGFFLVFGGVATEGIAATVLVNATASADGGPTNTGTDTSTSGSVVATALSSSSPNITGALFSGNATNSVFAGIATAVGVGSAYADYHREFSFTNSGPLAQTYSLTGLITGGGLEVLNSFIPLPSTYSGDAYFRWAISFQGNQLEIMKGSFSLSDASATTSSGITGSLPGGLRNVNSTSLALSWGATPFTTLLGTLGAGEVGNVSIDVIVSANSNFGLAPGYSYAAGLNAHFGDPSDISSYNITAEQVSAVPEPAEWLMLTAGLAIVASQARRTKTKKAVGPGDDESSITPSSSRSAS